MESGQILKWIGIAVLAVILVQIVMRVLGFLGGLLMTGVYIAVVLGIVWLVFTILTNKKSY